MNECVVLFVVLIRDLVNFLLLDFLLVSKLFMMKFLVCLVIDVFVELDIK